MSANDDLSDAYAAKAGTTARTTDASEMESWLNSFEADQGKERPPIIEPVADKTKPTERELPPPKPLKQTTDDSLGRPPEPEEPSTAGKIVKNVAEIPRQAVGGIDDAGRHALSFLDPLTDWLNDHVADLRYGPVTDATTPTGQLTRKISEFLTGFIPAIKGLKAMGVANAAAQGLAGGAIADFTVRDPHEGRLADLWNEFGLPKNVLTDYLKSKDDDTGTEARFKNALEGVGLGTLFEGVFRGAQAIRAARNVPGVKQSEEEFLKARYGEVSEKELQAAIGDSGKPLVEARKSSPAKKLQGAEEAVGENTDPRALIRGGKGTPLPEDFQVYVNFAKIDEPDKVKFVIGKMAEKMKAHIDEARRGVITQEETAKLADDLGMSVPDLLARRKGAAFNAEEAVASRQLWAASGDALLTAAKKAAGPNAGPLDQFAFRRMMAVHAAVQAEVVAGRTETARSLASWNIPVGGSMERARAIEQVMSASGGSATSQEMAKRLALLGEQGVDPKWVARFAERGAGAATMDAVREVWVNGLLSSPKTHAVNIMSNSLVALSSIAERAAATGIRAVTGGEGVASGETLAMTIGLVDGVKDAFRYSAKALLTGERPAFGNATKVDLSHPNAISPEAFRMSRETGLGRFVDFLGTSVSVPQKLLGAEDAFFQTIGYRMELRAQAVRQAASEGQAGNGKRIAEILDNPPEHIRINAADAALYQTFTNETGAFGRALMNMRNIDSPWNPLTFILPFVRTPVNIARYAFERTPFAPLVSQWRADIAAGGARADLALARMSTGTAIMLTAMDYASDGKCSGEGPRGKNQAGREALLREGWQPYSCKVGDRWYSYNRADPFGMTVGFAASIAESVKHGELNQDDVDEWQEVAAMTIAAVSQVTISKTYLEGFAKFVEVMSDPQRYSQKYIDDLFASFLPATALSNSVKNMVDPVQREANSPMEAVQARIAGLSKNLPPRRDLWGREITSESGLGKVNDFFTPVGSKPEEVQPIDKEITRTQAGPERIQKRTSFDGVMTNLRFHPDVYDEYTRLAGNGLKSQAHGGMGAMDYLNAVVTGKHPMSAAWNYMTDESQKSFIQSTISDFRKMSQQQILSDPRFKGFAAEVQQLKQRNMDQKMPYLGGPQ